MGYICVVRQNHLTFVYYVLYSTFLRLRLRVVLLTSQQCFLSVQILLGQSDIRVLVLTFFLHIF